jgi:phytoene dehydrogenase-like protein
MAGDTYDAIVIGAGVNGLATAATLARAGKSTLVLERAEVVGGSCAAFEFAAGFSAAPLGLDGGWLAPVVARGVRLEPESAATASEGRVTGPSPAFMHVQPAMSIAAEPGQILTLPGRPGGGNAVAGFSARDAEAWSGFVERLQSMIAFLESLYQEPAPDVQISGTSDLLSLGRLALRLRRIGRAGMTDLLRTVPMSVAELLDDTFESETLKAAIAAVGIRGIRQGPRSGGTAFTLLHNLIGAGRAAGPAWAGRFRPGGPQVIAAAFEAAARRDGAVIRTNAAVARIEVRDDAVTGVVLSDGEEIGARMVLSSADPSKTLLGMIDPAWLDPEFLNAVGNIRYRGSTAFVLYALDGLPELPGAPDPEAILAGTVSLTPTMTALERAYDATKYGETADRPHIEMIVPSLRSRGTAPAGRHVVVARVQYVGGARAGAGASASGEGERGGGPAGRGAEASTDLLRGHLMDRVTDAIACAAPGFADRILHRSLLLPADIEARYGYTDGAVSQGELMLDQILFMRPVAGWSRYAMPIDGLYLCGAAAHPGPGVPGAPGWLAAGEALRSRGR